MNNDYVTISHHGIMGMRWGVRRYQNPDGSLTPAGKARYAKVGRNWFSRWMETRKATKMLEKDIEKYYSQAESSRRRPTSSAYLVTNYMRKALQSSQYLSDIDNRMMQAGRDFIVQKDYNLHILPLPHITVEKTLVVKKKE